MTIRRFHISHHVSQANHRAYKLPAATWVGTAALELSTAAAGLTQHTKRPSMSHDLKM